MHVQSVRIERFRSIAHLEFSPTRYTALIGPNNHGKSNILRALDFFFSSDKPQEADFHSDGQNDAHELHVEVTFNDLNAAEQGTFRRYVLPDGTMRVRKTGSSDGISFSGYTFQPRFPWGPDVDLTNRATLAELDPAFDIARYFSNSGRITKDAVAQFKQKYAEDHPEECEVIREDGPFLGLRTVPGELLGSFYLIPAVRDLRDEAKVQSSTWFGRIFTRLISDLIQYDAGVRQVQAALKQVVATLNKPEDGSESATRPKQLSDLESSLKSFLTDWGATLEVRLSVPDLDKLFQSGVSLYVDDGINLPADRKGHGLQRAIIFALMQAWMESQAAPGTEELYVFSEVRGQEFLAGIEGRGGWIGSPVGVA